LIFDDLYVSFARVRPNNGLLCVGFSLRKEATVSLILSLTDGAAADTWLITQYACKAPETFQANFWIAIRYSSFLSRVISSEESIFYVYLFCFCILWVYPVFRRF